MQPAVDPVSGGVFVGSGGCRTDVGVLNRIGCGVARGLRKRRVCRFQGELREVERAEAGCAQLRVVRVGK